MPTRRHSTLYPQAPRARAVVDTWLDFQQTALNRLGSIVFQGLIRTAPEKRDNAAIADATVELGKIWGILDARLGKQPYIAGDTLTLADIAFGPHVHRWYQMPVQGRPEAPNLRSWYRPPPRPPRLQNPPSRPRNLTHQIPASATTRSNP